MFYKINPSRKPKQLIARQLHITFSLGDSVPGVTDKQVTAFVEDIQTAISVRHAVEIVWQRCGANTVQIEMTLSPEDERSRWLVWQLRKYVEFSANLDLLALS